MAEIDIIQLILFIVRLVIGFKIFLIGKKAKNKDLYYLASNFIFNSLYHFFSIKLIQNYFISLLFLLLAFYFYIIFIDKLFFKGRQSPKNGIYIISTCLGIAGLYYSIIYESGIKNQSILQSSYIFFGLILVIISTLVLMIFLQGYKKLKKSKVIANWVKIRYKILIIDEAILIIIGFFFIFLQVTDTVSIFTLIAFFCVIFSVFLEFIAWIMPKRIKNYFNRNYSFQDDEDLSEKELLERIKNELAKGE